MPGFYKAKYKNFIDEISTQVNIQVDKEMYKILKSASDEKGIPIPLLVQMAVDNELETPIPFNYPCDLPETEFVEGQYTEEAALIYKYIKLKPRDAMSMMLNRRGIGIESKEVLMLALRELIETGMIETFRPRRSYFNYPSGYIRYRVKEVPIAGHKPRYKRPTLVEEE